MWGIRRSVHHERSIVAMWYCISDTGAARPWASFYAEEVVSSAEKGRFVDDYAPKQDCRFLPLRLAEVIFACGEWSSRINSFAYSFVVVHKV